MSLNYEREANKLFENLTTEEKFRVMLGEKQSANARTLRTLLSKDEDEQLCEMISKHKGGLSLIMELLAIETMVDSSFDLILRIHIRLLEKCLLDDEIIALVRTINESITDIKGALNKASDLRDRVVDIKEKNSVLCEVWSLPDTQGKFCGLNDEWTGRFINLLQIDDEEKYLGFIKFTWWDGTQRRKADKMVGDFKFFLDSDITPIAKAPEECSGENKSS